jgi:hypothetical protein
VKEETIARVKVRPGRGRSKEYRGTRDNRRHLEPGPELWHMKGTKHKAWTEVQRPATLAEGMEWRGIAGSKSDVVGSQRGSEMASVRLWSASLEGTPKDLATSRAWPQLMGCATGSPKCPRQGLSCEGLT